MGADIHTWATDKDGEIINDKGKWLEYHQGIRNHSPFEGRFYRLFGWLGDVRNYSGVTPIASYRGWDKCPEELDDYKDCDYHSHSWVSIQELNDIDYDGIIEDRRYTGMLSSGLISGGLTSKIGCGETMTLREFLTEDYFYDLAELNRIGADRVWFCFDS